MTLLTEVKYITTKFQDIIFKFIKECPNEWEKIEQMYLSQCQELDGFLEIFPHVHNIFRCFNYFDPEDTKVILIGQDPYHGPGQATGLCFGVKENVPVPPSLRNIIKEMKSDIGKDLENQTLKHWAEQGVLMLNTSLTVRQGAPSSHMRYWKQFTKYIIQHISSNYDNIIYVVWGAFADKQVEDLVDWSKNHLIISSHPSPLSATKSYKNHPPFQGSKPFSRINSLMENPISWHS